MQTGAQRVAAQRAASRHVRTNRMTGKSGKEQRECNLDKSHKLSLSCVRKGTHEREPTPTVSGGCSGL